MTADILIIDDEVDIRVLIQGILGDEGYDTRLAANADQAYEQIAAKVPDLLVLDIWLQNSRHDGMEILAQVKEQHPDLPVLMISGHGNIETAVSAIKIGAYDFIEKPFKTDRLLLMIERALETVRLRRENRSLRAKAEGPAELVGDSPAMTGLRGVLGRVAQTNSRVLITGEPGTGKDIAARLIHRYSQRAARNFMVLNCAILHPERLESALFGEGAQEGILEQAHGGTLLLDEVSDMSLETQGKIVRMLQEQRIQRIGGSQTIEVDVRIIATTNRDLQSLMEQGRFRQDLYYRLNVVPIEMPPLRDRPQDIPALVTYFTQAYSQQSGVSPCEYSAGALAAMQAYDWPGNVRQLRNVAEWIMIMGGAASGAPVRTEQLPPEIYTGAPDTGRSQQGQDLMAVPLREAREMFERAYLESQVRRFGGNISKTAQFVEMERSALHRKIKQLGINPLSKTDEESGGDEEAEISADQELHDNRRTA